jgi:hypothetical protein
MESKLDFNPAATFGELIELCKQVAEGTKPRHLLHGLLKKLSANHTEVEKHITWSDQCYSRNQVHVSESFEIIVTCWQENQTSAPHDHGGSWGVVVPYVGNIVNRMYKIISQNLVEDIGEIVQRPGEVLFLDSVDIHEVESDPETEGKHISIHCYFPPVTRMNEYEPVAKVSSKEAAVASHG